MSPCSSSPQFKLTEIVPATQRSDSAVNSNGWVSCFPWNWTELDSLRVSFRTATVFLKLQALLVYPGQPVEFLQEEYPFECVRGSVVPST